MISGFTIEYHVGETAKVVMTLIGSIAVKAQGIVLQGQHEIAFVAATGKLLESAVKSNAVVKSWDQAAGTEPIKCTQCGQIQDDWPAHKGTMLSDGWVCSEGCYQEGCANETGKPPVPKGILHFENVGNSDEDPWLPEEVELEGTVYDSEGNVIPKADDPPLALPVTSLTAVARSPPE